ncbi:MAG TPA: AAA family ATPase, partial [Kofleriaceae bacterium]|nr:AAA family ATPase [Kofleriaceae bacterium]
MLVGRDREIAVVDGALAQLAEGRGAVALVSGEPGIGKTRLVSEAATRAATRGARVAWGRCWEAGGAPAFWPWYEALGGLGLRFPDAATIAASDPAQARFALFRDVAAELARAAVRSPLVLVLEDLHAADQSSVLLLEFLATQLRAAPIMVLGTYRDLEASLRAEVGDVIARSGRAGTVLALGRLRQQDVAAVVREAVEDADEALIARVFETTSGNPLFVTELVQQVRTGASSSTIPLGVREIIRQRLGLVSPAARLMLDAGAVLGVEFGSGDIARMATNADPEIDAAIASGLVTRRGDRVRFTHALYREALYHDLPRATRHALHRDAARVLSAMGAPAAEVAHHLIEAGPEAAPDAVEQTIVAARQALDAFAFEDAVSLLERAKLAVPAGPLEATLRARIVIALGEVRLRSGDPKGRELCVEGAQRARELGDASLLALAGLAYGSVFLIGGVDPVMVSMLEDALAGLPAVDSGLRARTMARLAAARQPSAPALRPRDIELALEAVGIGRRVATRRELLEILQSASGALYGAADPRVRITISRDQAQLAEELGDAPRLIAA